MRRLLIFSCLLLPVIGLMFGPLRVAVATHGDDAICHAGAIHDRVIIHLSEDDDTESFGSADHCIDAKAGGDDVSAGGGYDVILGRLGRDSLKGQAGPDVVLGDEGGDTVRGGDGDDLVTGDAGHDVIYDGYGADTIQGGTGEDTWYHCHDGSGDGTALDEIEAHIHDGTTYC